MDGFWIMQPDQPNQYEYNLTNLNLTQVKRNEVGLG